MKDVREDENGTNLYCVQLVAKYCLTYFTYIHPWAFMVFL